jgi:branched-chain amino acid transport system ATP-binding protein
MIRPRLPERRHHLAGQMSGGERQMLAVGRALTPFRTGTMASNPTLRHPVNIAPT